VEDNFLLPQPLTFNDYFTEVFTMEDYCDNCGIIITTETFILGADSQVADALIFCDSECRDRYRTDQM
jgi:hypothetical protein